MTHSFYITINYVFHKLIAVHHPSTSNVIELNINKYIVSTIKSFFAFILNRLRDQGRLRLIRRRFVSCFGGLAGRSARARFVGFGRRASWAGIRISFILLQCALTSLFCSVFSFLSHSCPCLCRRCMQGKFRWFLRRELRNFKFLMDPDQNRTSIV